MQIPSFTSSNTENDVHFDTLGVFNQIPIVQKGKKEDKYIFLCGKMFSHSAIAEYSFKVCDFHLYDPFSNILYHSSMVSDTCFTRTLKWTPKFYKKIRNCLTNTINKNNKKYYFTLNEKNKSEDEIENVTQKFFELHCIIDKDDIAVFRLLLETIVEKEPYIFIMNKALELDREEEEKLKNKQEKYYEKEKDISKNESEIKDIEINFETKQKELIVKFYLLNQEKNNKIKELEKEVGKLG